MKKHTCGVCGWEYDGPEAFDTLPDDYVCPVCGAGKEVFEASEEAEAPAAAPVDDDPKAMYQCQSSGRSAKEVPAGVLLLRSPLSGR